MHTFFLLQLPENEYHKNRMLLPSAGSDHYFKTWRIIKRTRIFSQWICTSLEDWTQTPSLIYLSTMRVQNMMLSLD